MNRSDHIGFARQFKNIRDRLDEANAHQLEGQQTHDTKGVHHHGEHLTVRHAVTSHGYEAHDYHTFHVHDKKTKKHVGYVSGGDDGEHEAVFHGHDGQVHDLSHHGSVPGNDGKKDAAKGASDLVHHALKHDAEFKKKLHASAAHGHEHSRVTADQAHDEGMRGNHELKAEEERKSNEPLAHHEHLNAHGWKHTKTSKTWDGKHETYHGYEHPAHPGHEVGVVVSKHNTGHTRGNWEHHSSAPGKYAQHGSGHGGDSLKKHLASFHKK